MKTIEEMHSTPGLPWWRTGAMWLVLGLPAAVVVAGFLTLWIALARPDAVVDPDYYAKGIALGERAKSPDKAHIPAQMGRNHAMTPDKDVPALLRN
ncbi:FixH family protein [Variovorax dokdonensis]|uniref:FixH family protein n=1 Tax=Variovorax dokdonensis TaxID=344883 RepID=A0ABT7NAW8_9BURK|nr:FixH family protein [Variovorax dokdonensis]MDM0045067.1 FixH family protein [Variovorax dokdonensis]